jgi:hypothetical protein
MPKKHARGRVTERVERRPWLPVGVDEAGLLRSDVEDTPLKVLLIDPLAGRTREHEVIRSDVECPESLRSLV